MFSLFQRYVTCSRDSQSHPVSSMKIDIEILDPKNQNIIFDSLTDDEMEFWNWKNTIPFVPPVNAGIVIKVYDGDTITVASRLPFDPITHNILAKTAYRFSVRLTGIDCAEMKSKTEAEKTHAKMAQKALSDKIYNKTVTLKNVTSEKYGRLLADVYVMENESEVWLNQWMLDNGHAVKYTGGTKHKPDEWI